MLRKVQIPFAIAFCVAMFSAVPLTAKPQAAGLRAEYERLSGEFAKGVPGWRPQKPATGAVLFVAADQYTARANREEQFRKQRNKYAEALFALAQQAAAEGQSSLAFQWATEAVRENPDHAEARRVLGYQQRDGRWLTAYGARMFDAGKQWHPGYGWVEASDLARYEAGDRRIGGRWVSAKDVARLAVAKSQHILRTDHFAVTSHSLEAAADLAARLERLYQVWRQLFAGFYLNEREVKQLFAGEREPRTQARPFRVIYHRDRDHYTSALHRKQPRIGETLGIYFDTLEEAHFFAGDEQDPGTLYHEAVHQLFWETKPAAKRVALTTNFWILEGVATYFETLSEHADEKAGLYYTIGEWTAGRLPMARERLLEGFYIPLAELTRLGKLDVQHHAEVKKLYGQSAGLTAFLMHGGQGRYREPLVRYLQAVYGGRDKVESLSKMSGVSYGELDAAYRRYLESLP